MTDQQIISMLKTNKILALEKLYDKHAAAMYELIFNLAENKALTEEIFTNAFVELAGDKIFSLSKHSLFPDLMKYTYAYASKRLAGGRTHTGVSNVRQGKLLHFLCNKCTTLNEVCYILNISSREAREKFRLESLSIRKSLNDPRPSFRLSINACKYVIQAWYNKLKMTFHYRTTM